MSFMDDDLDFAEKTCERQAEEIASLKTSNSLMLEHVHAVKNQFAIAKAEAESLKEQLAEREAEIVNLRRVLNYYANGNPALGTLNEAAKALSTPQSTPYLEQWEKEKYGEPVAWLATSRFMLDSYTKRKTNYVNSNDIVQTPLYARKEK